MKLKGDGFVKLKLAKIIRTVLSKEDFFRFRRIKNFFYLSFNYNISLKLERTYKYQFMIYSLAFLRTEKE